MWAGHQWCADLQNSSTNIGAFVLSMGAVKHQLQYKQLLFCSDKHQHVICTQTIQVSMHVLRTS